MGFERFCGMASASGLVLAFTLAVLNPGECISTIVSVLGWFVAIGAAAIAWRKSHEQIEIAQAQLSAQQEQIDDARRIARRSQFQSLDRRALEANDNIETLMAASAYLHKLADEFPEVESSPADFGQAMLRVRKQGLDAISASAVRAPYGFGPSIETTIGRLSVVGERMQQNITQQGSLNHVLVTQHYPAIQMYVAGIRSLAIQIDNKLPKLRDEFLELADERDLYSDHATTH